jgi:hypothetical protein
LPRPSDPAAAREFDEARQYVRDTQFRLGILGMEVEMLRELHGWTEELILEALRAGAFFGDEIIATIAPGGSSWMNPSRREDRLRGRVGCEGVVERLCGLARLPTARTVSNWLKQFTQATIAPLVQLNHDLVIHALGAGRLPRLTIDVDGTVVCTGAKVQWALRGFNPHHRKHLSYYPLLAHVAQTGHILRLKNRPGNVHDSKQAVGFVRDLIEDVRADLGRALPLEFRMDAAFFQRDILGLLAARGCAYAIKVGYWSWLPLKQLAAERRHWTPLAPGVTASSIG